jgi:hypothetical protein
VKAIKIIGLAALTALLAMAFVGASSAMAEPTALCKADENPCAEVNVIEHVHETSVGKAVLLSSVGNTECNVLFLGDAATVMSEGTGLGVIGSFTYTNCELGGGSCTAKEEKGPAEVTVLKEGHETAKVTGEGLVHLVCSGFIDCSYNGVGLVGKATGPLLSTQTNGEVTLSEQTTNKEAGGFLCPKTGKLDITTTSLVKTYISTPAYHLCVELEKSNGRYSGVSSGVCTGGPGIHGTGKFELVRSNLPLALNQMVCVRLDELKGLYVEPLTGSKECEGNLTGGDVGRYELGTAK